MSVVAMGERYAIVDLNTNEFYHVTEYHGNEVFLKDMFSANLYDNLHTANRAFQQAKKCFEAKGRKLKVVIFECKVFELQSPLIR